jgi:hypothetical protein
MSLNPVSRYRLSVNTDFRKYSKKTGLCENLYNMVASIIDEATSQQWASRGESKRIRVRIDAFAIDIQLRACTDTKVSPAIRSDNLVSFEVGFPFFREHR